MLFINLFFLSIIIAFIFITLHKKTKNVLVKSFYTIMACVFSIASILLFCLYLHENKKTIILAIFHNENSMAVTEMVEQQQSNITLHEGNIIKDEVRLDVPLIKQMPELPRGCEIVSLGMLLAFHNIHVDKMELVEEVKHNPAVFERKDGKTYFGNPHNGFVGDMYSLSTPGLGVYHGPIAELAEKYAAHLTIDDFTGADFSEIEKQLSLGHPVWVIINSHYNELPESEFITWHTEDGPIEVTYRLHSVLVTGYDEDFIYFNDPLDYHSKADKENFKIAWEQMGRQAIAIY